MASSNLITTPFTAASTAEDVARGIDLAGLRAVVTGASSGIGAETARVLVSAGAEVTLAVRNTEAGEAVAGMRGHGARVHPACGCTAATA